MRKLAIVALVSTLFVAGGVLAQQKAGKDGVYEELNFFDEAWVLAGPSLDTRPILIQIYLEAFQNLHFSYGMALSLVVTVVSLLVSLVYVVRVYRNTRLD